MRVLYIEHQEADLMSALMYLGICEELGSENVVDWPWKDTFHGETFKGHVPDTSIIDGIVGPYSWMPSFPGKKWNDDEIVQNIKEFDLVILASPRPQNTRLVKWLVDTVGRKVINKLVILDGEDYTTVRWDIIEYISPDVYFKLSMVQNPLDVYPSQRMNMQGLIKLIPIPLALPVNTLPTVEKDIDIAFLGGNNWYADRTEGFSVQDLTLSKPVFEAKIKAEFPDKKFVCGNLPYNEYMQTINRAKVAISVSGSGLEPLRTYEILSCQGTMLIRENIPVITPLPFINKDNCAIFNTQDDLIDAIRYYLNNENERNRIAINGNKFLQDNFTPRTVAQYLLREAMN